MLTPRPTFAAVLLLRRAHQQMAKPPAPVASPSAAGAPPSILDRIHRPDSRIGGTR